MYASPLKVPLIQRNLKQPKSQTVTRPRKPAERSRGLSQSLKQSLHQGLYTDLRQGLQTLVHDATNVRAAAPVHPPSTAATIRKISLLPGERVTHTFCPEEGLIPHPQEEGRMLVLTNQRVIAFGKKDGLRETFLMPVEEVRAVAVNSGRRGKGTMFQGGLMIMAGIFFYLLLAYWLTGRIDGPTIPVIRMDLVAFLVFLSILAGVGVIAQIYFSKPDGEVTFQGDGVRFAFPFRGKTAEDQIYQVVNATFAARQSIVGGSRRMVD